MRVLPAGPDAVLLDFSADDASDPVHAANILRTASDAGRSGLGTIADLIPAARTLLVQARPGAGVDLLGIHRELRSADAPADAVASSDPVIEIPVVYDGEDLDDVAAQLNTNADDVITRHRDTQWRVQFMGFAPGFGYLTPDSTSVPHPFEGIGRRAESRPRIPAGAVAIAAGYSAVYPRVSPGGWYLLGHTTIDFWNENNEPPALLAPGRRVRFVGASDGSAR